MNMEVLILIICALYYWVLQFIHCSESSMTEKPIVKKQQNNLQASEIFYLAIFAFDLFVSSYKKKEEN